MAKKLPKEEVILTKIRIFFTVPSVEVAKFENVIFAIAGIESGEVACSTVDRVTSGCMECSVPPDKIPLLNYIKGVTRIAYGNACENPLGALTLIPPPPNASSPSRAEIDGYIFDFIKNHLSIDVELNDEYDYYGGHSYRIHKSVTVMNPSTGEYEKVHF